jgi:hypothetical protein
MHYFLYEPLIKIREEKTMITADEASHDSNKDDEFPDYSVPIKYQPLMYTEDCIAVGCPEGLW